MSSEWFSEVLARLPDVSNVLVIGLDAHISVASAVQITQTTTPPDVGQFDVIFISSANLADVRACRNLANLSTVLVIENFNKEMKFQAVEEALVIDNGKTLGNTWVGSYRPRMVLFITSHNRYEYLERVLNAISKVDDLEKWDIHYHQDGLESGGFCTKTAEVANKWLDIIEKRARLIVRNIYEENRNIGVRQFNALTDSFIKHEADITVMMEDDTVLSPTYLTTIYNMWRHAERCCPLVAWVSGNYQVEQEFLQYNTLKAFIRRRIPWASGHLRRRFKAMYERYKPAHEAIFEHRKFGDWRTDEKMNACKALYDKVYDSLGLERNHCLSQDATQMECYKAAGFREIIYTPHRNCLPIGEEGLTLTPELFKRYGFDSTTIDYIHPAWDKSKIELLDNVP